MTPLSSLFGGGSFTPTFYSGNLDHELTSINPLVITPPSGKRASIIALTGGATSNVSVQIGSNTVINSLTLDSTPTNSGEFSILSGGGTAAGVIYPLVGAPDEVITISRGSGGATTVDYSYAYGD